jgi:WD40 repeat protein
MKSPNPESLKLAKDFSRPSACFAVARVPGTSRVFLGNAEFQVCELDIAAAKPEAKELYKHESYVTGVALAGSTLVSGGYDGKLKWWDVENNEFLRTTDAHSKWIRRVVASKDGSRIASVADDMVAKLWDAKTGSMIRELKGHELRTPHDFGSMLYAVAFSDNGKLLATGDKVGHVIVWDVETGKQLATLEAPVMYTWDKSARLHSIGGIRSLAFSPDGKQLAIGGMGKVGNIDHLEGKTRVEVFDWKENKQIAEFNGDKFNGLVNVLRWSPDGNWLLAAGGAGDGHLQFLDVKAKKLLKAEKAPMHIHDVAMNDDVTEFVAAGHNKVCVYKMT